jgi:release factor glutamine methyltransferase
VESTRDLLASAAALLAAGEVPTPDVDAELLLAHVTGRPRALLRMAGGNVTDEQRSAFAALVARRVQRIPLQHLMGLAPFRHLELHVGPGVFIPRPETEMMVDHVLQFAAEQPRTGLLVVDLCSGSAALALSIATELPGSQVIAVELSPTAVDWARRNIGDHTGRIAAAGSSIELETADATWVAADGGLLADLRGQVDVVVTNPPYVPEHAIPREPEVRDHDPAVALYGGPDGLEVVRPLAEQAALLLRPGGLLLVEHADVQGEAAGESGVPGVLRAQRDPATSDETAWRDVIDHLDLAGRPRHTAAIRSAGRMAP